MRLPFLDFLELVDTFLRERFPLRHRSPRHSQEGGEFTLVSSDFDGVLQIHGVPLVAGQPHKAEFPVIALDTLIGQALTLFLTSFISLTHHLNKVKFFT